MQIKQMDRTTVKLLSDAINAALQPLAVQYGVNIKRGSASFTDQNFTLKVEVAVIGAGGVAVSKEVTDFKRYAEFQGMKADDFGKTVSISGKLYTIAGYLVRSTRNPILVKDVKGKSWRMPLHLVTEALDKVRSPSKNKVTITEATLDKVMPRTNPSMPSLEKFSKRGVAGTAGWLILFTISTTARRKLMSATPKGPHEDLSVKA